MGRKKEYIILAILILALSVYLIVQEKDKTHYTLPAVGNIEEEDISKMVLKKKEHEIILLREDSAWYILPQRYPADSTVVDGLVDSITGLSLTALASESRNYTPYDLDENSGIRVTVFKDDTPLRAITIGKAASSFRQTFVRLDTDHRVFHATGNLRNSFDKTASELRDRAVLKFDDQITELRVRKGGEEITLVRTSPPVTPDPDQRNEEDPSQSQQKWQTPEGTPAADSEVDDIVNTLADFSCDGFIEDRTREDFQSPLYSVRLKGLKEYTVSFFEKSEDTYPALSSQSPYPFLVSAWKAEKIMKAPDSLLVPEKR